MKPINKISTGLAPETIADVLAEKPVGPAGALRAPGPLPFPVHRPPLVLPNKLDAMVDLHHNGADGALVEHIPCFRNIQSALDAAPRHSSDAFRIFIRTGHYYEKLIISKPGISLIGEHREHTVLSYDAVADGVGPDGACWGTAGSGSLIIRAPDFSAECMTIENSFDYAANRRKAEGDPSKLQNPQAVALMTDTGADRSRFRQLRILGNQDTLYVNAGRSHFSDCLISGHVDFILGGGRALFEACEILTRTRPFGWPTGWLTAACTQVSEPIGMVFWRCRLTRESSAVRPQSTFLGRPWHPTRTFPDGRYADPQAIASVSFLECWMDEHINHEGWDDMGGLAPNGQRMRFSPLDARLHEYRSSGPGAVLNDTRRQLTDTQAESLVPQRVLGDWLSPS